ncbi:hypothetical protein Mal4_23960 [Maioricimonas rarisocia]|uniref:Uncharacterized protein n=1 Tax=Maioricimonas rarisocia TaxID=2528026 RepID=A0A517Z6G2_9PLAN|nr:DUF1583 domain-containing protein [Maioricimonas rarisocia]QDU38076.1 hypothetical protein Mal4_23960 [Maioricimonas rarisocia]
MMDDSHQPASSNAIGKRTGLDEARRRRTEYGSKWGRCVGVTVLVGLLSWGTYDCQAGSDTSARSAIFAEQHVDGTALDVHRKGMALPPGQRFEYLAQWVLPGPAHSTLRMVYGFTPTHPAPPVAFDPVHYEELAGRRRVQHGGRLVSPTFDLIDVADELGRLDEIQTRVEAWEVPDQSPNAVSRSAMLALIALAGNDHAEAAKWLDAMLAVSESTTESGMAPTGAEVLVFDRCLGIDSLREAVASGLHRYQDWVRTKPYNTPHRLYVFGMLGRLQADHRESIGEPATPIAEASTGLWQPVSRTLAASRGPGTTPVRWDIAPGLARKVIGHDDDFLYWGIPLRGNYQVECDVTDFGWRECHLLVAGTWVAPVHTLSHYDSGTPRAEFPRREFSPPLTRPRYWIHYRTVVEDGTATTYFNGRAIHTRTVHPDAPPWLAIRTRSNNEGAVSNLRIIGDPEIPQTLRLSADPDLSGWVPYYDEQVGEAQNEWLHTTSLSPEGEIVGRWTAREFEELTTDPHRLVGVQESLLQYHRPMLEDGTIEYEFYYRPESDQVHPALDRLVFLLAPEGVRIHWLTDGPYDRTDLSSANVFDEPEHRRGDGPLPLERDDWNRLQLQLSGDVVTLVLNEEVIYERTLEAGNQRNFGLFHYADLSQARVRNVQWTGDWPRELPSIAEQQLAVPEEQFLLTNREHLVDVFEHDFAREGLPPGRFSIVRGLPSVDLRSGPEGVTAMRQGTGGYRNATISPQMKVHGDFDVIAAYDRFESSPPEKGLCMVALTAILDNSSVDEYFISRRDIRRPGGGREQLLHCAIVRRPPEGEQRSHFVSVPMEERSGRMWLARRGDRMYYLTAEGDSPNFRLHGEQPIASDPLGFQGLRLLNQIYREGGITSVVWKQLEIRAEKLEGRAVEPYDRLLTSLNRRRDELQNRFTFDFSAQDPHDGTLYLWNNDSPWKADDGGWTIINPGADTWTSAGVAARTFVQGDFDLEVEFDSVDFAEPRPGGRSSIYLQIEFPNEERTQVSNLFTTGTAGRTEVISQVRVPVGEGKYDYRQFGGFDLAKASALRMVRTGNTLTCLITSPDFDEEIVVGELEVPSLPIHPRNIRVMVHTSGAGRESRVRLKALDLRGETLGEVVEPPVRDPLDPPRIEREKSLLDSVLDLFR